MKYDILIEKFLKEAIGDTLGKLANIGATAVQNQQGKTVFDTLAKPGLEKKGNCINTNKDKDWESRLGVGKLIYVRFADPANSAKKPKDKTNINETLPEIKVQLKIEKKLGNGMFYAIIQDRERYYSRVIQSPTTGQSYSKIDIIKTEIDKNNQNLFRVLMGKGTMEPNFCFV
jgi:hypothetical protein